MKRAEWQVSRNDGCGSVGLPTSPIGVQVYEGIELGLAGRDAAQMSLDDFHWRNFSGADACGDIRDG